MSEDTKNDTQERVNAFLDAYKALVDEHKIDFATYPVWTPDGQGGFKTVMQSTPVDIKNQPVKSPVIVE